MMVAIQGIRGSYSEEAATNLLGKDIFTLECSSFADAFAALRAGRAKCAVVPLRNKIIGHIEAVSQIIENGRYDVVDRKRIDIDHILAGVHGSCLDGIANVYSHEAALRQCGSFLSNMSDVRTSLAADTATAIKDVVLNGDPTVAAISSPRAAEIYGAKIVTSGIADEKNNWTEFGLVIERNGR
jgi:chorismate mutase/prephenate dehydratase